MERSHVKRLPQLGHNIFAWKINIDEVSLLLKFCRSCNIFWSCSNSFFDM
uniref:Uncharacterized immunity region protein 9 n=1 Tax=Bacillus phage phi105 TaxID=10717 RepID=YIM9_BPPH1|nr:RecName: Full=Uncharacterized immunity region protein 9 [Bacillus phage phi105]prf//1112178P ORF 9 [Bacillus phage phi105]